MNLQLGDLLKVGDSASVKVVCSDLKMHDIAAGVAGIPCPPSPGQLRAADGSRINVTRSYGASLMVLAPRKTKVLSVTPMLRWTAVDGAKSYTVIVRADNFYWSKRVGAVTEMEYPQDGPKLRPDVGYKLVVRTEDKSSEDEAGPGLGFAVLDPGERKHVEEEQREVEGLGLPEGPTQFLIAHVYSAHDLRSEAIERLEKVSGSFKVAAARSLGDFYLDAGLMRDAEKHYLDSLNVSTPESDAGAPSVVASLWNVDDESTKLLMVGFYTHLRDGMSKAEALQAAQKEVRGRFPHPYYWASFELIGDPGSSGGGDLVAKAKF